MGRTLLIVCGLLLAIAGGVTLAVGGIPYTDSERIFEIGGVEATADVEKRLDVPPLAAGLALAAGAGMLVAGLRSRKG